MARSRLINPVRCSRRGAPASLPLRSCLLSRRRALTGAVTCDSSASIGDDMLTPCVDCPVGRDRLAGLTPVEQAEFDQFAAEAQARFVRLTEKSRRYQRLAHAARWADK